MPKNCLFYNLKDETGWTPHDEGNNNSKNTN